MEFEKLKGIIADVLNVDEEEITMENLDIPDQGVSDYLMLPNTETSGLQWMALAQAHLKEESYYVVQAFSSHRYLLGICPKD